jgi:bifunctional non-homologous end joining protein LigD
MLHWRVQYTPGAPGLGTRILCKAAYLQPMRKSIEFALPVKAPKVPAGPDWFHEIKHDGYRMMVIREQKSVRLITKGGHDWSKRFPWIIESALKVRQPRFILDGETMVLGVDGISDFDALRSRQHDQEAQFYAFDLLAAGGDDHRKLPLFLRKQNLAALAHRSDGIHAAPFEQGEIGPDLFRHACLMGLDGLVSKHRERVYGAGRCTHWLKVKNPKHPACRRVQDQF